MSLSVHVDSVKELPDVLGPHEAAGVDLGGGPGHVLDVVALEDELVLGALVLGNSNSVEHLHDPHPLLTQEVSDLDGLSRVLDGDVDREMGVHKPHGVPVTPSDSEDHVVDVGDNRPGSREPLARSVPDLDLHVWLAIDLGLEQVDLQVAQVPRQGSYCGGERKTSEKRVSSPPFSKEKQKQGPRLGPMGGW